VYLSAVSKSPVANAVAACPGWARASRRGGLWVTCTLRATETLALAQFVVSGSACRARAVAPSMMIAQRATPPPHAASVARFLSSLVRALAEDKRFELLRVSPTRFPILLVTVRRQSGSCVTRHDRTGRTVPAAAGRPRMRRKLRRTARHSTVRGRVRAERLPIKSKRVTPPAVTHSY
jgi:hypothetical protein